MEHNNNENGSSVRKVSTLRRRPAVRGPRETLRKMPIRVGTSLVKGENNNFLKEQLSGLGYSRNNNEMISQDMWTALTSEGKREAQRKLLLQQYQQQEDPVAGTPMHARASQAPQNTVRGTTQTAQSHSGYTFRSDGALLAENGEEIYGSTETEAPPVPPPRGSTARSTVQPSPIDSILEELNRKIPDDLPPPLQPEISLDFVSDMHKNFKACVWDFDDTLVSKHKGLDDLYKLLSPKTKETVRNQKDFDELIATPAKHFSRDDKLLGYLDRYPKLISYFFFDPTGLVNLITYLLHFNWNLFIASFGYKQNIIAIFEILYRIYGVQSPFNENNVYAFPGPVDRPTESQMLAQMKTDLLGDIIRQLGEHANILFFDDDNKNVGACQNQYPNVFGVKLGGRRMGGTNDDGMNGFHNMILNKIYQNTQHLTTDNKQRFNKDKISNIVFARLQQAGGGKTKKTKMGKKQKTHKKQNGGKSKNTHKKPNKKPNNKHQTINTKQ